MLQIRRSVNFSGDPFGLHAVLDAAEEPVLVSATTADATLQNDVVLRAEGVVWAASSMGPRTLVFCGTVDDGGSGLALTLRPRAATTIRLDGDNGWGGGTAIGSAAAADAAGTVLVTNAGSLGSGPVTLVNGGTLRFATPSFPNDVVAVGVVTLAVTETTTGAPTPAPDGSCGLVGTGERTTTLTGAISGSGGRINLASVPAGAASTIVLAAASPFDKPMSVLQGVTLRVEHPGALGSTTHSTTLLTGSTLEVAGPTTVVGETLDLNAPGQNTATWRSSGGANTWAGPITGSAVLTVDVVSDRLLVTGAISGFSFQKVGAGTLELGGTSSLGAVATVAAGSLLVSGSLTRIAVNVNAGASLGGTGTVIGDLGVHGTLAPGDGVGTLGALGDVTFHPEAQLDVDVDGATADRLDVSSGIVSLDGTLSAHIVDPEAVSHVFLSASGSSAIVGTFPGLPEGSAVGPFAISYSEVDVRLTPDALAIPPVAPPVGGLAIRPNPGPGETTIRYATSRGGIVHLDVFDAAGRHVRALVPGTPAPAGSHEILWNGRSGGGAPVSAGVYFVRLRAPGVAAVRRAVLRR
jgi:autotransporter-associated beta strand protein